MFTMLDACFNVCWPVCLQEANCKTHKASKVLILGNMKMLLTSGTSRWNDRQIALWDQVRATAKPPTQYRKFLTSKWPNLQLQITSASSWPLTTFHGLHQQMELDQVSSCGISVIWWRLRSLVIVRLKFHTSGDPMTPELHPRVCIHSRRKTMRCGLTLRKLESRSRSSDHTVPMMPHML